MARIYVSSTFKDLEAHRRAVYQQLTRMKHTVVAMEDYVARDDRPADACLSDVQGSDLYLGLFAWRYGYVPAASNPSALSVTELEERTAHTHGIPRLIFLLDETTTWAPSLLDAFTGDGDGGARIRALRKRLAEERLASFFTSPEDLANKVSAAVHLSTTISRASDAAFDLAQIAGQDVIDRPEMMFNQSYLPYLVNRIAELGDSPLLKIDLKDGRYWWSTKLYALATLAHELTSVEWFLFLTRGEDYVGMIRPSALKWALTTAQPELEELARKANVPAADPGLPSLMRAGQILEAIVESFRSAPGGEVGLRFLVDADWILRNVPGLDTTHVARVGDFDPLATWQLLGAPTPFVPVTDGKRLLKVIDRNGVANEIARNAVERQLGRR